eukprot:2445040-Pleurochrysis_carterae.AAC.1
MELRRGRLCRFCASNLVCKLRGPSLPSLRFYLPQCRWQRVEGVPATTTQRRSALSQERYQRSLV